MSTTPPRKPARRDGSAAPTRAAEQSWFGAFAPTGDAGLGDDSRFAASWLADAQASPDGVAASTFERIYRAFIAARAALGAALVATLAIGSVFGLRPSLEIALLTFLYCGFAGAMWILPRLRRGDAAKLSKLRSPRWLATIGADLVFFTALHVVSPGSSFNYVALLVLPVLMAGVLTPRILALGTAALATIAMLVTAWLTSLVGGDATQLFTQAGIAGSGFFVVTMLAGELARRIAREQSSARGSLEVARQQAQLNRLVIEEMEDGVLVVDRGGRVRAANPAARRLLAPEGMSRAAPFQLRGVPAWGPLVSGVEQAFGDGAWPENGRDVRLQFAPDAARTLRVRVRFTKRREPATEQVCVLFLEDVRTVQARSRQEKLAAMGRVSAGIAHEIRNPLAAIAQANALLGEDAIDPGQQKLTKMVAANVERLKRIVDDVMEVAPGHAPQPRAVDATAVVAQTCTDWARAAGVSAGDHATLRLELPGERLGVVFDADHLRRVVVNLLDNARRHASDRPSAIVVSLGTDDRAQATLSVESDGDPITSDIEAYLFEPFFSTRSRGTGLGLYICRELCERYGSRIEFRLLPADAARRNDFFVEMRRAELDAEADATLPAATTAT